MSMLYLHTRRLFTCRGSSVVEHSTHKAVVVSSILTLDTSSSFSPFYIFKHHVMFEIRHKTKTGSNPQKIERNQTYVEYVQTIQ